MRKSISHLINVHVHVEVAFTMLLGHGSSDLGYRHSFENLHEIAIESLIILSLTSLIRKLDAFAIGNLRKNTLIYGDICLFLKLNYLLQCQSLYTLLTVKIM